MRLYSFRLKRLRHDLVALSVMVLMAIVGTANTPVAAHELKEDNGVSAVLHISPDDNPKSGQDTLLYFAFDAENPKFDLVYCKCQVSFQATDNRLSTTSITPVDAEPGSGYAKVKFDKPGVYALDVRGMASDVATDKFEFTFTVRVVAGTSPAKAASDTAASIQIIALSITSLIIIGVIGSSMIRSGTHYDTHPKRKRS